MLGREGSGKLGGRRIALIAALLSGYVFGSTAWGQFVEAPTGGRVMFTAAFALFGFGLPWLIYGIIRLLGRLVRGNRRT